MRLQFVFLPILALIVVVLAILFQIATYEIDYILRKNLFARGEYFSERTQNGENTSNFFLKTYTDGENRIEIEKIGVSMSLLQGREEVMNRGAWLRQTGVSPDQEGNIIITAHRFLFLPPSSKTFYHLDKLSSGDEIKIFWEHTLYTFYVSTVTIKEKTDAFIEYPSATKKLSLYTCTPLWSAEKRLVVIAYPK